MNWLAIVVVSLLTPVVAAADSVDRDVSHLNISVAIFDPGIPEDRSVHRDLEVFPRVRKIEALYLPFVLRNVLASQKEWGAIRVVPDTDTAAELLINGRIVRSDGNLLEVMIRAVDASGRVWVERNFSGPANDQDIYNLPDPGRTGRDLRVEPDQQDTGNGRNQAGKCIGCNTVRGDVEPQRLHAAGIVAHTLERQAER